MNTANTMTKTKSIFTRSVGAAEKGAITVELVFLNAFFSLPVGATFVLLGIPLLRWFRYEQLALVGPFP
ncbi:MAG: hypothetical protein QOI66_5047 [Myxococcales bacterium]|jgi:hypothetical protein|nr:hypothetical protein [Myxococcales bacterium]